ncbi:XisI protein [Moorena producens JHB]|uniref:XisI protein n=1 Tax=Moorena producens (strain JHB) TaxID=1454205 RepID=A0A1D9FXG7_MOOP1|nr:XisI protein [Moorena producens]AOY79974.1 XisI protein [Moorena producens JHB]
MDRLKRYRQIVQEVVREYHQLNKKSGSTIESALVFDEVQDQYLLLLMGWHKDERIKSVMIHIRLKDDKIWIEEDWTEDGVATDLLQKGILREEIVLAFHPPHVRQYTEFAFA